MDLNYKVTPIFPTCIHSLEIDNFDTYRDQLIKESYQNRDEDPMGRELSNRGGWQSDQVNILKCKSETLKKIITDSLVEFKPIKNKVSIIIEGWTNINGPGDSNVKHVHPKADFSGVLWIKAQENCGNILFETPNYFEKYQELHSYTDEFALKTNSYMTYFFYPKEGKILIFPSSLSHQVEENKSDEDRISYSFNIKLINEE